MEDTLFIICPEEGAKTRSKAANTMGRAVVRLKGHFGVGKVGGLARRACGSVGSVRGGPEPAGHNTGYSYDSK